MFTLFTKIPSHLNGIMKKNSNGIKKEENNKEENKELSDFLVILACANFLKR